MNFNISLIATWDLFYHKIHLSTANLMPFRAITTVKFPENSFTHYTKHSSTSSYA